MTFSTRFLSNPRQELDAARLLVHTEALSAEIVHVIEDLGVGGMERAVQSFALLARAAGFSPRVLCLRAGGVVADELRRAGIRVDVAAALPRGALVHSHGAARAAARVKARLAGARGVIHHLHGTEVFGLKQRLFERALPPSLYLACSEFVAGDLRRQLGSPRVEVLHNPVDVTRFDASPQLRALGRRELGAQGERPVVLTVGRFAPDKGQRFMVAAVPAVLARFPEALFVFVGDGPARAEAERLAAPRRESFRFVGVKDDVRPYLAACDVYAQPSVNREGLGLAVLEAMACARPVVASSLQGLGEAVGDAGRLVEPGDADRLAAAVVELLEDPAARAALGARARERVEREFSSNSIAERLASVYRRFSESSS